MLTPGEERQVAAYLDLNYPEIVRYWREVSRHNSGISREEYPKFGIKDWYFQSRLDEAMDQVRVLESFQDWDTLAMRNLSNRIGSEEL